MDYAAWKDLPPRQRATWPSSSKGYLRPQEEITISIDADLAAWAVDHIIGQSSFSSDFEETFITTLRVIKGDISVDELVALKTLAKRRSL